MNKRFLYTSVFTLTAIVFTSLVACSSRKEGPDPAEVEQEISGYRSQELELVRETVADLGRAENLVSLLSDRDSLISRYAEQLANYDQEVSSLHADYHAKRESFEDLAKRYNVHRAAAHKEFVDLTVAMKKETTPEEWKKISKFQMKRLNPQELIRTQPAGGS